MGVDSIERVNYVILLCRDMRQMKHFYQNVMRFPLGDEFRNWLTFCVGSQFLTLRPRGTWLAWNDGDIPPESASVQLAFGVTYAEVDRCYEELVEHGARIIDPPTNQEFGHRTLFFRDPDGNILEIYAEL